eukprot:TRINITY_DN8171_c0_g2_i5.p1 TRINITY_DN8171_c0_g2~~TRINITY_DN8171_c0_g2_i5.p1  ORF type:complete len:879 (+),score=213.50 TRINITY_DN8171_c0_g2_i5:88-2637(+)
MPAAAGPPAAAPAQRHTSASAPPAPRARRLPPLHSMPNAPVSVQQPLRTPRAAAAAASLPADTESASSAPTAPTAPGAAEAGLPAMEARVCVAVRLRPLLPQEQQPVEPPQIRIDTSRVVVRPHRGQGRSYKFSDVFDATCSQDDVYHHCVSPLMEQFFRGYNCTVLAYGQTGSGKTFTMGTGDLTTVASEHGIVPRVAFNMFATLERKRHEAEARTVAYKSTVVASYVQIYKEKVQDLLPTSTPGEIKIRNRPDGSVIMTGAREEELRTTADMLRLLEAGSRARATGVTKMNDASSRSHSILTVTLTQRIHDPNDPLAPDDFLLSKLHLVDLAGSERNKKTQATGAQVKEAAHINSALSSLGNVISALAGEKGKRGERKAHVPYRDSNLTRLLQDSLGGNARTLMIACISPVSASVEESISTLEYASRAQRIRNVPIVNRGPLVTQLREDLQACRGELQTTRGELQICRDLLAANGISYEPAAGGSMLRDEAASAVLERATTEPSVESTAADDEAVSDGAAVPGAALLTRTADNTAAALDDQEEGRAQQGEVLGHGAAGASLQAGGTQTACPRCFLTITELEVANERLAGELQKATAELERYGNPESQAELLRQIQDLKAALRSKEEELAAWKDFALQQRAKAALYGWLFSRYTRDSNSAADDASSGRLQELLLQQADKFGEHGKKAAARIMGLPADDDERRAREAEQLAPEGPQQQKQPEGGNALWQWLRRCRQMVFAGAPAAAAGAAQAAAAAAAPAAGGEAAPAVAAPEFDTIAAKGGEIQGRIKQLQQQPEEEAQRQAEGGAEGAEAPAAAPRAPAPDAFDPGDAGDAAAPGQAVPPAEAPPPL